MLRKKILLIFMLVFLVGCAGLQDRWDKLTPDEQARIVLNGLQDQVDLWLSAGIAYVDANPTYRPEWKAKVVPLFDLANQAVKDALIYKKSPSDIYATVSPTVNKAVVALKAWGVSIGGAK